MLYGSFGTFFRAIAEQNSQSPVDEDAVCRAADQFCTDHLGDGFDALTVAQVIQVQYPLACEHVQSGALDHRLKGDTRCTFPPTLRLREALTVIRNGNS